MGEGGREGGKGEDEVSTKQKIVTQSESVPSLPPSLPSSLPHLLNQLLELGVVNPGKPLPVSVEGVLASEEGAAGVGVLGHKLVFACEGGREGGREGD